MVREALAVRPQRHAGGLDEQEEGVDAADPQRPRGDVDQAQDGDVHRGSSAGSVSGQPTQYGRAAVHREGPAG